MSRWEHWSVGTEERKSFSSFLKEGNPTGTGLQSPAEKARAMGLQSDGKGGYRDPKTGQLVARTVNNELAFYDPGPSGGIVADGNGGAYVTQAQPSWRDPRTGMAMTPPSRPESKQEIAAVPYPTPAKPPMGFNSFMQQKKDTAYDLENPEPIREPAEGEDQDAMMGEAAENPGSPPPGWRMDSRDPKHKAYTQALLAYQKEKNSESEPKLDDLSKVIQRGSQEYEDQVGGPAFDAEREADLEKKADDVRLDLLTQPDDASNPSKEGEPDLDTLLANVRSGLDRIQDVGGKMSANGDELGDQLVDATDGGNIVDAIKTIKSINDRSSESVGGQEDVYKVTSPGGLGSDRGRYVEQGLTDHVFPQMFEDQELDFHNDGGPRVKTDVRSSRNGQDNHRYTVKSTVGTDGLEANNAGFRRFFDMWGLDPQSGPGQMFSHLMGIPLDWAQEQGFGDGLGLWDDKRDGLHRDGLEATRKMPLQQMYPGFDFSTEELNANSMLPDTFKRLFPQQAKEGMEWLMDSRPEIVRRIMSQRDNDFGVDGQADPNARPNVDFDPNPVDRAAWYHLDKNSRGKPNLKGRLDIHDVSPEQVKKVIENAQWNLSDSISGGLSLDVPHEGRGGKRSLMTLTRKANKAGGGRYGNGFHSPRFGYKHNSFDVFPHVSSTPLEMTMGAKQNTPLLRKDGSPQMDRQGNAKTKVVDGKILPGSVKIGKTNWGKGYSPQTG